MDGPRDQAICEAACPRTNHVCVPLCGADAHVAGLIKMAIQRLDELEDGVDYLRKAKDDRRD